MKYTLIAFHWAQADSRAGGSELSRAVACNQGGMVEIAEGVYLYRTAEDALYIHRLSEVLRRMDRSFLLLRFESETSELSGCFPDDLYKKLALLLGREVGNLKEKKD